MIYKGQMVHPKMMMRTMRTLLICFIEWSGYF